MMRARWFGPAMAARTPAFFARPLKPGAGRVTVGATTYASLVQAATALRVPVATLKRRLGRS